MIVLLLLRMAWAADTVDLTVHLPKGRTLTWTHLLEVRERSHWGVSHLRAVLLTRQSVSRGGRLGVADLEWSWRTERASVNLSVGDRRVAEWDDRRPVPRNSPEIAQVERLSRSGFRVLAPASAALSWFRIEGDGTAQGAGPSAAEMLNWFSGVLLGGEDPSGRIAPIGAVRPGEVVRRVVTVPVWSVGVGRCELALSADAPGPRSVIFRYSAACTPLARPVPADGPRLLELSGEGGGVLDLRHHRITEHVFDAKVVFQDGMRRIVREERMASFLDRVRRGT